MMAGALKLEVEQSAPMPLAGALRCEAGELTALVGPSGAGKTSMLRVVAGLMRPQRGRLEVGGECWLDTAAGLSWPPQRRRVGMVFQHYALMPHLSALDNVALALTALPRQERQESARRWLERLHLTGELLHRRPAALSGGQQQRVAVARALARAPRVLLLDEPFSAVDQMNRRGLYEVLAEIKRTLAVPMLLVTHDLQEARMLCDRLVVMDAGQVLQEGTPGKIYRAPRNARVADLTGIQNRFSGIWEGPDAAQGWGRLAWRTDEAAASDRWPRLVVRDKSRIRLGQAVHWVIPGEAIALDGLSKAGTASFAAVVEAATHLGEATLATLALADWPGVHLKVTASGPLQKQLVTGARVTLAIDLAQVHVMPVLSGGGPGGPGSPGGPDGSVSHSEHSQQPPPAARGAP